MLIYLLQKLFSQSIVMPTRRAFDSCIAWLLATNILRRIRIIMTRFSCRISGPLSTVDLGFRVFVELCAAEAVVPQGLQTVILEMRNGKKLRTNGSAKNAAQLTARRRQARKRNATPRTPNAPKIIEFIAPKTELPVVKAPPSPIVSPLPFLFWTAFPIAMMQMWLAPRNTGVRK